MLTERPQVRLSPIKEEHVDQAVDLIARDLPMLPNYKGITVDKDVTKFTIRNNLNNTAFMSAWVLLNDKNEVVGGSAGYCVQLMFSKDYATGDIFLSIDPAYRTIFNAVRLVTAYKDWAISRNAKLIQVTHTGGYRREQMERFLNMQGFELVGSLFHLRRD